MNINYFLLMIISTETFSCIGTVEKNYLCAMSLPLPSKGKTVSMSANIKIYSFLPA